MKTHCKPPKSTTWLTPPELINVLGPFDLDPCCPPNMPWRTASKMIQEPECGLTKKWDDWHFVWMNPPFTRGEREKWMEKLANHPGGGIMLIPAATETKAFYEHVWKRADYIFWLLGRPHFCNWRGERAKANCGCAVCLVGYGDKSGDRIKQAWHDGRINGALTRV